MRASSSILFKLVVIALLAVIAYYAYRSWMFLSTFSLLDPLADVSSGGTNTEDSVNELNDMFVGVIDILPHGSISDFVGDVTDISDET